MKHHPICIPNTFNGILAWSYNCNTKIPGYDTKYEISDNLGANFIEDTTACYTQFATLLGTGIALLLLTARRRNVQS
jgi:hypothetical protein